MHFSVNAGNVIRIIIQIHNGIYLKLSSVAFINILITLPCNLFPILKIVGFRFHHNLC